jgi:hypothetical protein
VSSAPTRSVGHIEPEHACICGSAWQRAFWSFTQNTRNRPFGPLCVMRVGTFRITSVAIRRAQSARTCVACYRIYAQVCVV